MEELSEVKLLPTAEWLNETTPVALTVNLPNGLIGCEMWQNFTLEIDREIAPLMALHSVDQPDLSFIVADPRAIEPSFNLQLSPKDEAFLGDPTLPDLAVIVILNSVLSGDTTRVTANLLGPVVINVANGIGCQVIQPEYSAQHPVGEATTC